MNLFNNLFSLRYFAIAALIIFSDCSRKEVNIPNDVLSKQEIISVLVDIHLAQSAVNKNLLTDSVRYGMKEYTPFILSSHHITKEKYETSIAFYTLHPDLIEEVYQEVINELSKKQGEAERK